VAENFKTIGNIRFYKINLSLNDIPGLQLEYLPAFGVYPIENKQKLILYDKDTISLMSVLEFISQRAKMMSTEQLEELKREYRQSYPFEVRKYFR